MKSYKDIYQFPLTKWKDCKRVYDSKGNFVFQFEPRFNDKGEYQEDWEEIEEKALDTINGKCLFDREVYHIQGNILFSDDHSLFIVIRGWGNLTGVGGHNLPEKEAANIQDTFAEHIVEQLNKKQISEYPKIAIITTTQEEFDKLCRIFNVKGNWALHEKRTCVNFPEKTISDIQCNNRPYIDSKELLWH